MPLVSSIGAQMARLIKHIISKYGRAKAMAFIQNVRQSQFNINYHTTSVPTV